MRVAAALADARNQDASVRAHLELVLRRLQPDDRDRDDVGRTNLVALGIDRSFEEPRRRLGPLAPLLQRVGVDRRGRSGRTGKARTFTGDHLGGNRRRENDQDERDDDDRK
jgi:hypothetical protein